jgi:hypothetical protein
MTSETCKTRPISKTRFIPIHLTRSNLYIQILLHESRESVSAQNNGHSLNLSYLEKFLGVMDQFRETGCLPQVKYLSIRYNRSLLHRYLVIIVRVIASRTSKNRLVEGRISRLRALSINSTYHTQIRQAANKPLFINRFSKFLVGNVSTSPSSSNPITRSTDTPSMKHTTQGRTLIFSFSTRKGADSTSILKNFVPTIRTRRGILKNFAARVWRCAFIIPHRLKSG